MNLGYYNQDNSLIGVNPLFVVAPYFENGQIANLDQVDLHLVSYSPYIDQLEEGYYGAYEFVGEKTVNTTYNLVTTLEDEFDFSNDVTSLREAIYLSSGEDTIYFAEGLEGSIKLNSELFVFNAKIDGDHRITIDAQGQSRAFNAYNLSLSNLNIVNGLADNGGAIYINNGNATFVGCTISGNTATRGGGGVYVNGASSKATFVNCVVTGNTAREGGGVYREANTSSSCPKVDFINCTLVGNSANSGGAVYLYNFGAGALFTNSIIALNLGGNIGVNFGSFTGTNNLVSSDEGFAFEDGNLAYEEGEPLFVDQENGDYTILLTSKAYNAGSNQLAEESASLTSTSVDCAGNPRIVDGVIDIGAYEARIKSTPITLNTPISGKVTKNARSIYWSFSAKAGSTLVFRLLDGDADNVSFKLTNNEREVTLTNETGPFTIQESGVYYLVVVAKDDYVGAYTFELLTQQDDIQTIELNQPYADTLPGSRFAKVFKVDVPEAGILNVDLTSAGSENRYEMYVKYGASPSRTDYNWSGVSDNGTLSVMSDFAHEGTYYILVYANYAPAGCEYELTATLDSVLISDFMQTVSYNDNLKFNIEGAGFRDGVQAYLVLTSGEGDETLYEATCVNVASSTLITAEFPADLPCGEYKVRLTGRDSITGSEFVKTSTNVCAVAEKEDISPFEINIYAPDQLGFHIQSTLYVEYSNTGSTPIAAPLVCFSLVGKDGREGAILTLDPAKQNGFWTRNMPDGYSHGLQFMASGATPGVLQPGESIRLPVYWNGWEWPWNTKTFAVDFDYYTVDSSRTLDLDQLKESLKPERYSDEVWDALWPRVHNIIGDTRGSLVKALDEIVVSLYEQGRNVVEAVDLLQALVIAATDEFNPMKTMVESADFTIENSLSTLGFTRYYNGASTASRYNDSIWGYGWDHSWNYSLKFRDDGDVELNAPLGGRYSYQLSSRSSSRLEEDNGYVVGRLRQYLTTDPSVVNTFEYGHYLFGDQYFADSYRWTQQNGISYLFDSSGKLTAFVDANENVTTFDYDASGKLTAIADAFGRGIQLTYNGSGKVAKATSSEGKTRTYLYDETGAYLVGVTSDFAPSVAYEYDASQGSKTSHALLKTTELESGSSSTFSYDAEGRLVGVKHGAGGEISYAFGENASDILSYKYYVDGEFAEQVWLTEKGRIAKVKEADGDSVRYEYDAYGRLAKEVDQDGVTAMYKYDGKGNVTKEVNRLGKTTLYKYNGLNDLVSVTDAEGHSYFFEYDEFGNKTKTTREDGTYSTVKYNRYGLPVVSTDRNGNSASYEYNDSGRAFSVARDDSERIDYIYDERGNLTQVVQGDNYVALTYNENDALTKAVYADGKEVNYAYDSAMRVINVTTDDGYVVQYGYDEFGNLAYVTDADSDAAPIARYEYNSLGQLISETSRNGVTTTYEFDVLGYITSITATRGSEADGDYVVLSSITYEYDSRGNVKQKTDSTGTWTYVYDYASQLKDAIFVSNDENVCASRTEHYEYDDVGNRISITIDGVERLCEFDNMNRLLDDGEFSYEYDANGSLAKKTNLTTGEVLTFSWNSDLTLKSIESSTGEKWEYSYDLLGNLTGVVHMYVDGTVEAATYLVDPQNAGNVLVAYSAEGTTSYVYGEGGLTAQSRATGVYYYGFDMQGSTSILTNDAGEISAAYSYSPWGGILRSEETIDNPYQFVGKYGLLSDIAPSDVISVRARWYDANAGRFISEDPIGLEGGDVNLYRYCGNNPSTFVDTTGNVASVIKVVLAFGVNLAVAKQIKSAVPGAIIGTVAGLLLDAALSDECGCSAIREDIKEYEHNLDVVKDNIERLDREIKEIDSKLSELEKKENEIERLKEQKWEKTDEIGRIQREIEELEIELQVYQYTNQVMYELTKQKIAQKEAKKTELNNEVQDIIEKQHQKEDELRQLVNQYGTKDKLTSDKNWRVSNKEAFEESKEWYEEKIASLKKKLSDTCKCSPGCNCGKPQQGYEVYKLIVSYDPNEMLGPEGYGDAGYILGDSPLSYRVNFENDAAATAPAQLVDVEFYLDPNLDWSTFRFTSFGWADENITLDEGVYSIDQTVETSIVVENEDGTTESVDIYVQVTGGIELLTGRVWISYQALQYSDLDGELEEAILMPPRDPRVGFLLPTLYEGEGDEKVKVGTRGDGFVSYIVSPKTDLQTNDTIRAIAEIQFDLGEVIATNQIEPHDPSQGIDPAKECLLTIDKSAPVSCGISVSTAENGDSIVTWSAEDEGTGVVAYDVFVSKDGGDYKLWLDDVVETSAIFPVVTTGDYSFYFVAYDGVGHATQSSCSDVYALTPSLTEAPDSPDNLVVSSYLQSDKTPILTWTAADSGGVAVGYSIYLIDGDEATLIAVTTKNSYTELATAIELQDDSTYVIAVSAFNEYGESDLATVTLDTSTASPTLRVVSFDEKNGLLGLEWAAVGDEYEYLVEESTDGGLTWAPLALAGADENSASIPIVDFSKSFLIRVSAFEGGCSSNYAYAQVLNLPNYSPFTKFELMPAQAGALTLVGVNKDGFHVALEVLEYSDDFYLCVLGKKSTQEDFAVSPEVAALRGRIDFIDSGTNNTITINCSDGDDLIVIGTEIVETTEQYGIKNPYEKLIAYYASLYGEDSMDYLRLKAQYDKAYKSLMKKVKTVKSTWGTISIEGGTNVRFFGAKTATVNAGDGDDVVKIDSLGFNYVVSGGEGDDKLTFADAPGAVKVSLDSTSAQSAIAKDRGKLQLKDAFESFVGSVYNDTITGSSKGTVIDGNGGSDKVTLVGGVNDVTLTGPSQSVTVNGTGTYHIKLEEPATKSTIRATGAKSGSLVTVEAVGDKISFAGGSGEVDVRIEGNEAVVKNSGTSPARVVVIGDKAKVTTAKGDDYVKVVGDNATVSVGDGDDVVEVDGAGSKVTVGGGVKNDVTLAGERQTLTVSGDGTFDIKLTNATKSTIKASGVKKTASVTVEATGDQITFTGGSSAIDVSIAGDAAIVKNSGELPAVVVVNGANANVTTGKGDDDVRVHGDSATINVGDGNDRVEITDPNSKVTHGRKGILDKVIIGETGGQNDGSSGATLDDEFGDFLLDGINAFFGDDEAGRLLAVQPVKLDGGEENNRKELDKLYESLFENWDVEDELDPTLDLLETLLKSED